MSCFSLLVGCGRSSSNSDSSTSSTSANKKAQKSKKDAAAASYSKALKKQQESYPASESRKAENAAKNDITALGTKYVTYVMKSNAYHEFWGLDLKNGEDPDTDGRSEYDAYEFLPGNEFY